MHRQTPDSRNEAVLHETAASSGERRPAKAIWLMLPIILLLLIGAIGGDSDITTTSQYSGLVVGPITNIIKSNISFIYIIFLLSFILAFFLNNHISFIFSSPSLLYSILYFYGFIRLIFSDMPLASKQLLAFFVMIGIQIYASSLASRGRNIVKITTDAFFLTAILLVAINMIEYAAGYGFIPGRPRFFGSSSHPNSIGIQMGICALALVGYDIRKGRVITLLKLATFAGAVLLLFLSGSRSALGGFICGWVVIFALKRNPHLRVLIFVILVALVGLAVAYGLMDTVAGALNQNEVYARGTGSQFDTRTDAWSILWNDVLRNPFLGNGVLPRSTENSFLRGWSTIGILYPIALIATVLIIFLKLLYNTTHSQLKNMSILLGIFTMLTVGGIFEGYLFDRNSMSFHAWFICLSVISLHIKLGAQANFIGARLPRQVNPVPIRRN